MSTWNGHKQNYVFKTDKMGTGYYLDKKVSFKNVEVQNYDPNAPQRNIKIKIFFIINVFNISII